ncbi:MAG: hypothetical protein AAB691_02105 [Patescibacteria group bacterium]
MTQEPLIIITDRKSLGLGEVMASDIKSLFDSLPLGQTCFSEVRVVATTEEAVAEAEKEAGLMTVLFLSLLLLTEAEELVAKYKPRIHAVALARKKLVEKSKGVVILKESSLTAGEDIFALVCRKASP